MVTIHREAGFRFVIYLDDHEPAHVHVVGDGEAKILIAEGDDRPRIVYATGMTAADLRRVVRIVDTRRRAFLEEWTMRHG